MINYFITSNDKFVPLKFSKLKKLSIKQKSSK